MPEIKPVKSDYREEHNDRVSAQLNFSYNQDNADPVAVACHFSRVLAQASEEPYLRKITLGEVWEPLDFGWLRDHPVGMVLLNYPLVKKQVYPTEEERQAQADKIIEVSLGDPEQIMLLHPGMFLPFLPSNPHSVVARCRSGTARLHTIICPESVND